MTVEKSDSWMIVNPSYSACAAESKTINDTKKEKEGEAGRGRRAKILGW